LGCEVIVKFVGGMTSDIVHGKIDLLR
jgi:hypothetical protein